MSAPSPPSPPNPPPDSSFALARRYYHIAKAEPDQLVIWRLITWVTFMRLFSFFSVSVYFVSRPKGLNRKENAVFWLYWVTIIVFAAMVAYHTSSYGKDANDGPDEHNASDTLFDTVFHLGVAAMTGPLFIFYRRCRK